jgi:hypothetical protein
MDDINDSEADRMVQDVEYWLHVQTISHMIFERMDAERCLEEIYRRAGVRRPTPPE